MCSTSQGYYQSQSEGNRMSNHAKQQCWVKLVDGREAICDKQIRSGQADCVMVAVKDEKTGKTGAFQPMKLSKIAKAQMTIRAKA